jgi:adenosylhomocysteine nucleosidase
VDDALTLACALELEEKAARKAGARTARVGFGAALPLPEGRLVSFGLAGGLVPGLRPGTLLTAERLVDESGRTLWEGAALQIDGARPAVICAVASVADDPAERRALAERTGAVAADMESGVLAASGRLVGILRAVSDTPEQPVGGLASAAAADGGTNWRVVGRSFAVEPVKSMRTALAARRAFGALERAAAVIAKRDTGG